MSCRSVLRLKSCSVMEPFWCVGRFDICARLSTEETRQQPAHHLHPTGPESSVRLGEAHFECGPGTCGLFAAANGGDGLSAAKRNEGERGLRAEYRLNRSQHGLTTQATK